MQKDSFIKKQADNMGEELDKLRGVYDKSNVYALEDRLLIEYYVNILADTYRKQNKSCLDLGIGHGVAAAKLDKVFQEYTIIEGSQAIIDDFKLQHKGIQAEIVCSYFEEFETEKKYDIIVMGFVLEHVNNPAQVIARYKRFLKRDGKIYVALPNHASLVRRMGKMMGLIETTEFFSENDIQLGHKTLFDVESIKSLIESANLKLHSLEGIYMKAITTEQMNMLNLSKDYLWAAMAMGKDYPELSVAVFASAGLN